MAVKSLLFDLDGTIWDSKESYVVLIHEVTGTAKEQISNLLDSGQPIASLLKESGITKGMFRGYCQEGRLEPSLYPGVRETLAELAKRRVPMGIVTNLPQWVGEPMLRQAEIDSVFHVINYYSVRMRRNKAAILISAIKDMGMKPGKDIFYVGDTDLDYQSALEAGISFAWASYGYGDVSVTDSAHILSSFRELLGL